MAKKTKKTLQTTTTSGNANLLASAYGARLAREVAPQPPSARKGALLRKKPRRAVK